MLTRFSLFLFYVLHLLLVRVKCSNLYVHPKTVYITGGKLVVSCTKILDGHDHAVTFGNDIEWVKLNSLSVISSHPEARVRRDGHRLLFDSTDHSDEGLYCCRSPSENRGCTYNSTVRVAIAGTARAPAKNLQKISNPNAGHNVVAKSTSSGTNTWRLEALPQTRCVLLGQKASINCLNNSNNFAQNIQWFRILSNEGLQLIPHSIGERITSNAHQLQFARTVAEDEGMYCCKAFSETKCSPTAIANITISLPPVLDPLQNHTTLIGETVVVNCTINVTMGEPTTLRWQKNGKGLPSDPKYSIIKSNNSTTLIITNVTIMDRGYYSCIVQNRKFQQDNQSMYLDVELPQHPPGCNMINTSYSITIGVQTSTKSCSSIEVTALNNVTNRFLQSICNCSDYCMTLEVINCSPDDTIATVVLTIKEKHVQPLLLSYQAYAVLKGGQVPVRFEDKNYFIFCVVNTLCEPPPSTPTLSPYINTTVSDSEITEEDNTTIPASTIAIAITAGIVLMLLVLILLVIIVIILWLNKCKQKSQPVTKNEHPQTTLHVTNPTMASSNEGGKEHPSVSSNESGFHSSSDCGSPVSNSIEHPFPPNAIHSIDNSNTSPPNDRNTTRTNHSFPAVKSSNTKLEIKTNKINSVSKHHRNIQLTNEPHNIQWKKNKTYSSLNFHTANVPPINFYEDVEGISGNTRRAAAVSHVHHKKHQKPRPPAGHRTRHPLPVYSNHDVLPVHNTNDFRSSQV